MSMTQQELGRRIRTAREACRLTQEAAANHLEVSRPTFVQIEAGNRSVSSLELDKLAYLFGRDIREFLADQFREADALTALFRVQPGMDGDPAVLEALRACIALGRELTGLEGLVGVDRALGAVATYPLSTPRTRWEAVQQGQRLADEERRRFGLGQGPLPDLSELMESQGIRTGAVDLPDDVSGLTLIEPSVGLFVVVNGRHHPLRRRFSLAHEYAHVVADRERAGVISRASARDDLIEVRANAFAAHLLMPEEGVRPFVAGLGKGRPSRLAAEVFDEAGAVDIEGRSAPGTQTLQLYDVVQVAHHFGVSRLSAMYRLRNLRLLTEAEFEALKSADGKGKGKQLAKLLGLVECDEDALRSAFKHRFLGLALEAYRRDEISRGKLRELVAMVGLSARDLGRLLDEAGLAEVGGGAS